MIEGRIKVYEEANLNFTTTSATHFYDTDEYEEHPYGFLSSRQYHNNQIKYVPIEKKLSRLIALLDIELPKTGIQIGSKVKYRGGKGTGTVIDISYDPITSYCDIDDNFEPLIVQLDTDEEPKTVRRYSIDELELINDPIDTTPSNQQSC